jgi:hypothetical protein
MTAGGSKFAVRSSKQLLHLPLVTNSSPTTLLRLVKLMNMDHFDGPIETSLPVVTRKSTVSRFIYTIALSPEILRIQIV